MAVGNKFEVFYWKPAIVGYLIWGSLLHLCLIYGYEFEDLCLILCTCDVFEGFPAWVCWSKNPWVDGCHGFCS